MSIEDVLTTKRSGDEEEETEQKTTHTKLIFRKETGSFEFG